MIGLKVPFKDTSFYWVANNVCSFSNIFKIVVNESNDNSIDYSIDYTILVDEAISSIMSNKRADVYWVDTPCIIPYSYLLKFSNKSEFYSGEIYVTSKSNRQLLEEIGFNITGIIGRPASYDCLTSFKENMKKDIDIIFIGKYDRCDRKNVLLTYDILNKLNCKSVIITDFVKPTNSNVKFIRYNSLTEKEKADLISRSRFMLFLTHCEGFGMPVLEAMSCGTIPIFTNTEAVNEFGEGIKVDVQGKYRVSCYGGYIDKVIIDKKEVIETVKYALSIDENEYEKLRLKCYRKAVNLNYTYLLKLSRIIPKLYRPIFKKQIRSKFNKVIKSKANKK